MGVGLGGVGGGGGGGGGGGVGGGGEGRGDKPSLCAFTVSTTLLPLVSPELINTVSLS